MSGTKTFLMVLLIVSATEGLEMAGLESLDEMGWNRVGPRDLRTSAAGSDSPMVVLILQLGCGHCTKLVDSLPSAMLPVHKTLKKQPQMSYVVCNEDLDYCRDNLNIKWFPEVRIYSSGHFSTFESKELGWSTLSQWLIDSLSQTIQGLGDDKIDMNLKTIFNQKFLEEQVIILLSGDFTKNQLTTFEGLAKLFPKIHFIRVSQKETHEELSPLDYSEGAILVFSRIEGQCEKVLELEGSKLINPYQFLESLHPQPGLELSQALIEKAIQQQKTLVVLFTSPSELSSVASFQRIAFKNLNSSTWWVKSTLQTKESLFLRRLVGLNSLSDERIRIIKLDKEGSCMKFKDDSRIWLESLPTLLQNHHSGSIHAYLKTPQNALVSTASFIHVTTENFETVIFGSEETVVLLVLAPIDYCAQCPALATHFEQLSMTAARQGLVFAMTNAFENEFDEFLLPTFPQIFVFSSPNKEETQGQSISSSSDLDLIINKLIEGQELLSHTDL